MNVFHVSLVHTIPGKMLIRLRRIPLLSVSRSSNRTCSTKSGGEDDDWWGGGAEESGSSIFGDSVGEENTDKGLKKPEKEFVRRSSLFTGAPRRRTPVIEGTPRLSVSEALFLAKEAGIFTTREVQTHIIKSPSFSVDKDAPFVLENFFASSQESEPYSAEFGSSTKVASSLNPLVTAGEQTISSVGEQNHPLDVIPQSVHEFLLRGSKRPVTSFVARGREWLEKAQGKGTRKRSVAHVVLERGSGIVKINGEEDLYKRWPLLSNRFDVLFPFELSNSAGLFDVYIKVRGGGISGQAGAARLAIGRALVAACSQVESDLKDSLILHEDTRQKTSKFPGKPGAYARRNWTLR